MVNSSATNSCTSPTVGLTEHYEAFRALATLDWCAGGSAVSSRSSLDETVPLGQGGDLLRAKIIHLTAKNFHLLSPQSLKELARINNSLFQILLYKRLGHAFSLKGNFSLPGKLQINFESFHETFTLPMLAGSFSRFLQNVDFADLGISAEEKATLFRDMEEIFRSAIWHDNLSYEKLESLHRQLHDGAKKMPLVVGSGWDWHSTQVIFYKNGPDYFFIYCNCGSDSGIHSGWILFKIGDERALTQEWIKNLTSRMNSSKDSYLSLQKIVSDLKANPLYYCKMQKQKSGCCTYRSVKAVHSALLTVWMATNGFSKWLEEDIFSSLQRALPRAERVYKLFNRFDKEEILSATLDWLDELYPGNGASTPPSDPTQIENANDAIAKLVVQTFMRGSDRLNPLDGRFNWSSIQKLVEFARLLQNPYLQSCFANSQIELRRLEILAKVSSEEELKKATLECLKIDNNLEIVLRPIFHIAIFWRKYDLAGEIIGNLPSNHPSGLMEAFRLFTNCLPRRVYFDALQQITHSSRLGDSEKALFLRYLFRNSPEPFSFLFNQLIQLLESTSSPNKQQLLRRVFILAIPSEDPTDTLLSIFHHMLLQGLKEKDCTTEELKKWLPARDTIILWKRLATAIKKPPPTVFTRSSFSDFIREQPLFSSWLDAHQQELSSLKTLTLFFNHLYSLPKEMEKLTSLHELEIVANHLTTLPKELFQLTRLTTLICKETLGKYFLVPEGIGALTNLRQLSFQELPIHSLPNDLGKLTNLTKLNLTGCKNLSYLPPEISARRLQDPNFQVYTAST